MNAPRRFVIAAVGDLHFGSGATQPFPSLHENLGNANVLVLCGDLTDHGTAEETHALVRELAKVRIPMIAVLGNHDYESGEQEEVTKILIGGGITVLDGSAIEIEGVGFAGTKGFLGGFGRRTLEPWGEAGVKAFVREAMDECVKLEKALARLRTEKTVAVMHYAPVQATVEGEPPEIFPFLGCGRLEEPLNRYGVSVVFHGHAHRGTLAGRTQNGAPVYNVSLPLLRATGGPNTALHFVELELQAP